MAVPGLDTAGPGAPAGPAPAVRTGDPSRLARIFGLTGALLMAFGALGAGALPVPNPFNGLRVLGLPGRNVTVSIALVYAGMGMLVLAWLWIGRMLNMRGAVAPAPDHRQLARTGLLWALPLTFAPPLFSKDVYSYLAQSAITARGLDPYSLGPAQALGVDDPLTRAIPTIWRNTPAPYGPLFLGLGRGITAVSGDDVVLGLFLHRLLALVGVGLILWALTGLARRCGVEPGLALWLGVVNPLVLFHLVSGIHNEALMIGLMLAGLEVGLRATSTWGWLAGAVLITAGAAVKLPAILALGFLGMHLARRRGGRLRDVGVVAAALGAVAVAVFVVLGYATGLGFGWLSTLSTANTIRSWMSLSTDLGQLAGQVGIVAGLGDHTDTTLMLTRGLGGIAAAVLCCVLLLRTLRGRIDPVTALGVGLGAVVLLGPVVHPWYLLWATIPLAATRGLPRYRRVALAATVVLAVMVPPTGSDFDFRAYQLPMAIIAGVVILVAAAVVARRRHPGEARPPSGTAASASGSAP